VIERLPTALLAGLVGWCLGFASAWATDYLQAKDEVPSAAQGPWIRDLGVQAGCAVVWVLAPLLLEGPWWRWVAAGLIAVPLVQVAVTDLRHRYLYNPVAAVGIVVGLGLGWLVHGGEWWYGLLGAAGGLATFGVLYLLGRVLFRGVEALATGDITIGALIGATAGACTPSALFLGIILSGLFSLGILIARRKMRVFMPYGPGLCLGGLVALFAC
jgi:prepilin signal peptidase PulO-like enzyme (type II secretory pathway)